MLNGVTNDKTALTWMYWKEKNRCIHMHT